MGPQPTEVLWGFETFITRQTSWTIGQTLGKMIRLTPTAKTLVPWIYMQSYTPMRVPSPPPNMPLFSSSCVPVDCSCIITTSFHSCTFQLEKNEAGGASTSKAIFSCLVSAMTRPTWDVVREDEDKIKWGRRRVELGVMLELVELNEDHFSM